MQDDAEEKGIRERESTALVRYVGPGAPPAVRSEAVVPAGLSRPAEPAPPPDRAPIRTCGRDGEALPVPRCAS